MTNIEDLYAAVIEGAVQRIRPKNYDCLRNNLWSPSHHVVTGVSSRCGRDETDCYADDRR